MMKIEVDWSKAPEGTTHYVPDSDIYLEAWYKKEDERCSFWLVGHDHGWCYIDDLPPTAIARPTEWNGIGLPPVDVKCKVRIHNNSWVECTVVAHFEGRAVVVLDNSEAALIRDADQLRPIRTPEQIAAEKREREINDLVEVIVTHYEYPKGAESYIGLAKALHSAGYRKTEQEKNNEQ